jgi:hypothetical protein
VPSGAVVVAPPDVGVWITTFHEHAHPLQSRRLYLERHRATLGHDNVNFREFMTQYVGGAANLANPDPYFSLGLSRFEVKGVLLRDSELAAGAREVLERSGFERTLRTREYEIWVRSEPS